MKECEICKKLTKGFKTYINGNLSYIDNICPDCMMRSAPALSKTPKSPGLTCARCLNKVYAVRNYECLNCYLANSEAASKLPTIEEIEPPLGWMDKHERTDIERIYHRCPGKDERPC